MPSVRNFSVLEENGNTIDRRRNRYGRPALVFDTRFIFGPHSAFRQVDGAGFAAGIQYRSDKNVAAEKILVLN